jgi:hypothetical protein
MIIRFFGSSNCRDCLKIFVLLNKYLIEYEYIDADEDDTQDLCDEQEVFELPHLQFVDEENNIIDEHIGQLNSKKLEEYLTKYFSDY